MNRLTFRLTLFATILALIVVTLGAYARLKDAGLGCPDWPGCYGHFSVPHSAEELQVAMNRFPDQPVEAEKAWPEMIHRYVAGSLALIIFILALQAFSTYSKTKKWTKVTIMPLVLFGIILFQALLGKWTVTLRLLPTVVMSHLLGGMSLFGLLSLFCFQQSQLAKNIPAVALKPFRYWGIFALIIILLQIALGGWTSANYAALACHDFPTCKGQYIPTLNFKAAFNLFIEAGPNYQGGLLDNTARITIHFMHRFGALITFIYIGLLSLGLIIANTSKALRYMGILILITLLIQIGVGIMNVILHLPLHNAVMHNGVAAILFAQIVCLNAILWNDQQRINYA
ncbi:MAG: Heme A synthase [Legionellaceae bacterium]